MSTSDAQIDANRHNAEKSTGPKTEAGKNRSRMNGSRHNLTGHAFLMTDEDRVAYNAFSKPYIAALKADNPIELQLAQLLAQDNYRLNRIHAIEENTFSLGFFDRAGKIDADHPEVHHAMTQTLVFATEGKTFNNLSLYEQRITRNIHKNMKLLIDLQDRRKAEERLKAFAAAKAESAPRTRAAGMSDESGVGFGFSSAAKPPQPAPETTSRPLDPGLKEAA